MRIEVKLEEITNEDIKNGICVIPEGVTKIGDYAFADCESLESITIPSSVTAVGCRAFSHCSRLTEVALPEGLTEITNFMFSCCKNLRQVTLPEGITRIGGGAFYSCSNLVKINLPKGVTKIGTYAFLNCENLVDISLPDRYAEGIDSFLRCKALGKRLIKDQGYVTAKTYQMVTGVHTNDIRSFLYNHNMDWNSKKSVEEMLELTKGEYGGENFKKAMQELE